MVNLQELEQILIKTGTEGYATGGEDAFSENPDTSKTYAYTFGKWISNDNYFGGEPFGGRWVISLDNQPVWMMVYYGGCNLGLDPKVQSEVIILLRQALATKPEGVYHFRGPKLLEAGDFKYINNWSGDIEKYSGEEVIYQGDQVVYKASYIGGLVDQVKD